MKKIFLIFLGLSLIFVNVLFAENVSKSTVLKSTGALLGNSKVVTSTGTYSLKTVSIGITEIDNKDVSTVNVSTGTGDLSVTKSAEASNVANCCKVCKKTDGKCCKHGVCMKCFKKGKCMECLKDAGEQIKKIKKKKDKK